MGRSSTENGVKLMIIDGEFLKLKSTENDITTV